MRLSGIQVEAGQTKDLGVVELSEGIQIKGTVTDKSGVGLRAYPAGIVERSANEQWTQDMGGI